MFSQNKRDQWSKKSVVGAVNVIRVSLLWNDRKRKKVWAHSCFFCSSLGTFEFWLLFFLFVVCATGFEKRWHLTASQGSWFSVSKHSIFFHCHEMLVLKELKQRTFWATQANRKGRKDRLPPLARESKWRACSQAMWNSWLVVRPKLPREQPLIIIHIQIIYSFLIFLNLSTNYWMRLRPKTHENCIILQIIQKPNPICYNYSFQNSSYFKTSCKVVVFVQLFICLFFGKCRV